MVKEYYIVDVYNYIQNTKTLLILYDSDSGSGLHLQSQSSPGERKGKVSEDGTFGQNGKLGPNSKVHLVLNVSSSVHNNYYGYVVDGGNTIAAI